MIKQNKYVKKIAFALSVAMVLVWSFLGTGTSLAWFADTSDPVKNIINVADFDLQAFYKTGEGYKSVEGISDIFKKDALYEPGYVEVVYLKIVNDGTVPFNFVTTMAIKDYRTAINHYGDEFKLQDYLQYGVLFADTEAELDTLLATREQAKAVATEPFDHYESQEAKLNASSEIYMAIVITMPEQVQNDANYVSEDPPEVELMLIVTAEQLKS